jgi:uncharacterized protein YceH (UPF0502 family)
MHAFADLVAVHETLSRLIERGLVACLERRPGQKEDRYTQLLEDQDAQVDFSGAASAARPASSTEVSSSRPYVTAQPLDGLEERVARLEREVAALRAGASAQAAAGPGASSTGTGDGAPAPEPAHEPRSPAWP